jgi:hypothetical protein
MSNHNYDEEEWSAIMCVLFLLILLFALGMVVGSNIGYDDGAKDGIDGKIQIVTDSNGKSHVIKVKK